LCRAEKARVKYPPSRDVAGRLVMPKPHASDAHAFAPEGYVPVTQISTDGFPAYPEAVDLAFGPYVKFGTIQKEYRSATMIYTPSEMVGTKRTGIRGIRGWEQRTICTSHVERLNGTQRLFLKRLNQEATERGSRFRHVRRLLQLLLADPLPGQEREGREAPAYRLYDGGTGRARLEL
jgi:hypothetical protein